MPPGPRRCDAWRSTQWSRAEKQRLATRAGELVLEAPARFGGPGVDGPRGSKRALAVLGVQDSVASRASALRALDGEIVPGFEALGFAVGRVRRP